MRHFADAGFWKCYYKLPEEIRDKADKQYEILKTNPKHPSLHFKKIRRYRSVRVDDKYRALAIEFELGLLWFWIGHHDEYEVLLQEA